MQQVKVEDLKSPKGLLVQGKSKKVLKKLESDKKQQQALHPSLEAPNTFLSFDERSLSN